MIDLHALEAVRTWTVGSAAVAVVGPDGLIASAGPIEDRFAWASVTKLVAATAVLVGADEGALGLDDPAGPPGSTVRHLLAHASGLPFEGTAPVAVPGTRRIYSNTGIEVVTAHLAAVSGISFDDYLHEGVLEPLGMSTTTIAGSPAWAGTGSVVDLVALAREFLRPQLLSASTAHAMRTVQFPGLRGVLPGWGIQDPNDWGLGAELRDHKSPHWTGTTNSASTFGHFGRSGSFLWVDPEADVAMVGLASDDFGDWAIDGWPTLADAVLDELRVSRT